MGVKNENDALSQEEDLLTGSKPSQINLVMSGSDDEEDSISLVNVFHNMKAQCKKYLWLMLLFAVAGVSIALLAYQLKKQPAQVSSVVTLKYDVDGAPVTDLTAPDGTELDLSQFTSSYVLNNALSGLNLSKPVTVEALRNNLEIQKIITKDTRRQQELISGMMEGKSNEAYKQAGDLELVYQNNFLVSLRNDFSEEGSRKPIELTQEELQVLLERVILSYNEYLCHTYADLQLPGDAFSVIDYNSLDILESLDQLSAGVDELYEYCDTKADSIKAYRSWRTGHSLEDLMRSLRTVQDVDINYLRSYVEYEAVTNDAETILTKYRYQLRQQQIRIDELQQQITTTADILDTYKNDSVLVSSQDNASNLSTGTTTEYYNELVTSQAENYEQLSALSASCEILSTRIAKMEGANYEQASQDVMNQVAVVFEDVEMLYRTINDQMEEIIERPFCTTFIDHTAAQGKNESFLKAGSKNMLVGAGAGIAIVFAWWFMAALIPELMNENGTGKKETAK